MDFAKLFRNKCLANIPALEEKTKAFANNKALTEAVNLFLLYLRNMEHMITVASRNKKSM